MKCLCRHRSCRAIDAQVGELEKELLNLHTLERRDIDHRIKVAEARLSVRSARAHVRRLPPMRPDWREEKHQADEEYTELLGKVRCCMFFVYLFTP